MKFLIHSEQKITGYYQYRDQFIVRPVIIPEDIPIKKWGDYSHRFLDYPCIVDITQQYDDIDVIRMGIKFQKGTHSISLSKRKLFEVTKLLSVFTNSCFYGRANIDILAHPQIVESKIYINLESKFPEIEKANINDYYQNTPLRDSPLALPTQITMMFDKYFILPSETQQTFYKACSLFHQGCELIDSFPSLSYAAFISAIETIVSFIHKDEKKIECTECHSTAYHSTKNFKDFFKEYGENSKEFEKEAKEIYKIRSQILHNGSLFLFDDEEYYFLEDEKTVEIEILLLKRAINICRVCFVNWLIRYQI